MKENFQTYIYIYVLFISDVDLDFICFLNVFKNQPQPKTFH